MEPPQASNNTLTSTIEFQTFSGYGCEPKRDNHSPEKIQKARRITVKTSFVPERSVIKYRLIRLSHDNIDTAIPSLSLNHNRDRNQKIMLVSPCINAGEAGTSTIFLYTIPFGNRHVRNQNDRYQLVISIKFVDSNIKHILYSFEFKPVRNHNFEGTLGGVLQSQKNTDILNISIVY